MTLHWQELTVVAVVAGIVGLAGFGGGALIAGSRPGRR